MAKKRAYKYIPEEIDVKTVVICDEADIIDYIEHTDYNMYIPGCNSIKLTAADAIANSENKIVYVHQGVKIPLHYREDIFITAKELLGGNFALKKTLEYLLDGVNDAYTIRRKTQIILNVQKKIRICQNKTVQRAYDTYIVTIKDDKKARTVLNSLALSSFTAS